ncbi:MAG: hypothetical protein WCI21_07705 [Alphaproteobacteria bacterium]
MRPRFRTAQTLSLAILSCGGLTACANLDSFASGDLAVSPDSPVAIAAREAQRNPGPWPTFASIHKTEGKGAAPSRLALSEAPIQAQADRLRAEAAANPPTSTAVIEAFVAQQKAIAEAVPVPTESATPEIEAFVRAARARATPPPPPS